MLTEARRRRRVQLIHERLLSAQQRLDFGEQVGRAEDDVRWAMRQLRQVPASDGPVEFELHAMAAGLLARALRLRGALRDAGRSAARAELMWRMQLRETRRPRPVADHLLGALNTQTLIAMNHTAGIPGHHDAVTRAFTRQLQVMSSGARIDNQLLYRLDTVQRLSEIALRAGAIDFSREVLRQHRYQEHTAELTEHTFALRNLFLARVAAAARDVDAAADALGRVQGLTVARTSPFVGISALETEADVLEAAGEPLAAHAVRERANEMRMKEHIDEERRFGRRGGS